MNEEAKQQLLEHLDEHFGSVPVRKEGFGVTAKEYVDHIHEQEGRKIEIKSALVRLNKMVEGEGWKVQQMIDYDGRKKNVYFSDS